MRVSKTEFQARMAAPFGIVGIRTEGDALAEIAYLPRFFGEAPPLDRLAARACRQIERYLEDPHYRFDLPLKRVGTPFQCRVWEAISAIPAGRTRGYGDIAKELRSAPRAVGRACGANYFPLVIPCHRVVARGGLGGFANGEEDYFLSIKRWLLEHERGR